MTDGFMRGADVTASPEFFAKTIEEAEQVLARVVFLKHQSMEVNQRTLLLLASRDLVSCLERLEQAATL